MFNTLSWNKDVLQNCVCRLYLLLILCSWIIKFCFKFPLYFFQPLTELNININKKFPIPKHDVINKNDDIRNLFKIYHQNIRGLKGKTIQFMLSLLTEAPHLICLTEHHLKNYELDATPIPNYKLGAKYCREKQKKWRCLHINTRSLKIYKH